MFVREDHIMYHELWGDYEDVLVSDLVLCTENKRDENQRWLSGVKFVPVHKMLALLPLA
jgi:hypothetical protein